MLPVDEILFGLAWYKDILMTVSSKELTADCFPVWT